MISYSYHRKVYPHLFSIHEDNDLQEKVYADACYRGENFGILCSLDQLSCFGLSMG